MSMMVDTLVAGGFASEHDGKIARKLAEVLCGGKGGAAREVTESEILDLEAEAFVSLTGEPKSQERMQFMLMNNKRSAISDPGEARASPPLTQPSQLGEEKFCSTGDNTMIKDIVIAEAVRSAVGRAHKGSLANKRPDELAGEVVKALMARVPGVKPSEVEDLVLGCAMPEGEQGLNLARVVGLLGGLSEDSAGVTINRFCSSGLQAIAFAAGAIATGANDIVIAGGVESMTMVPMTGNKITVSPEVMEHFPTAYTPMGITAEKRRHEVQHLARGSRCVRSMEP